MEYTVQKLARLSGVSTRTLRYYDELGLLHPARKSSSGYRIYGGEQVDRLQQILFYRELGMALEDIRTVLDAPGYDEGAALAVHRESLLEKRARLDALIANVDRTIASREGGIPMRDKEKFEGFKRELIEENERKYGEEARRLYGDETMDRSNRKLMGMDKAQYDEQQELSGRLMQTLKEAFLTGDPAGEKAKAAAELHRRWLMFWWSEYTPETHAGVARMYVEDPRFTEYYDKEQPGLAAFLRDAVLHYTKQK